MTTIRTHPLDQNLIRIVVKGAPENLIPLCQFTYDDNSNEQQLDKKLKEKLLEVVRQMAATPLKVLSYAHKDVNLEDLNNLLETFDPESPEFREHIESELTYVGTFGLEDPLRNDV
jgi:magnesium-transporting ATPase (P-type)